MKPRNTKYLLLTTLSGTGLFILLYLAACFLYPGGSQVDQHSISFSWLNNYWCNLMNEYAINGEHNPGRPVALVSLIILCLTLLNFWVVLPLVVSFSKYTGLLIRIAGATAMICCLFIASSLHDNAINIAVLFGLIATIGMMTGLYKLKWYFIFSMGILNFVLIILNNFLYYSRAEIVYLPIVQKISFLSFLAWFCLIAWVAYKQDYDQHRPVWKKM